ncbi:sensor domain-containing protein [Streptomyces sp. NBC_01304]|uniref:sensor domain-containing protein n=1 Tax=Streptomyces sp. NBC_01304 TaxID=2903818 RepID=UPI002E114601|nr:sensor domain-containing protein [Streptomyces sp. NBC_01304]
MATATLAARTQPVWRRILRAPFTGETWRRAAYLLIALPAALLCLVLALVGSPAAGRIQRSLARRLLGVEVPEPDRASKPLALAHAVLTLPLTLIATVVTGFVWFVMLINLGYPLRPDSDQPADYAQSWGGPTLAGAWGVHILGGTVLVGLLMPWIVKGFTALQGRLVRAFHGADRAGLRSSALIALVVAAGCVLLSIPIIHQF